MIVSKTNIKEVVESLMKESFLGIDCETSGLDYQDRLFSFAIAGANNTHYFNFNVEADIPEEYQLDFKEARVIIGPLFARTDVTWFIHNASFDLDMLERSGFILNGELHCTMTIAKLQNNSHPTYTLDAVSQRAGFPGKDDRVMEYLNKHKLYEKGPNKRKRYFFNKVPFDLIVEYTILDVELSRRLGLSQLGNGGTT